MHIFDGKYSHEAVRVQSALFVRGGGELELGHGCGEVEGVELRLVVAGRRAVGGGVHNVSD